MRCGSFRNSLDLTRDPEMTDRPCVGPPSRREFLRAGVLGLGGLSLPALLAARERAGQGAFETSVILFWKWGGPSQLETWDMKPQAPSEYRGPFSPIATNVPGIDICELFPQQARQAHRFSLVEKEWLDMTLEEIVSHISRDGHLAFIEHG